MSVTVARSSREVERGWLVCVAGAARVRRSGVVAR
jgi:hypothetical protein